MGFWQEILNKKVKPLPTQGLLSWGTAEIYHRPFVHNSDGSVSTIYGGIEGDDTSGYRVRTGISPQGQFYQDTWTRPDNIVATFDTLQNAENFEKAWHDREIKRLEYERNPFLLQGYINSLEQADHPERFNNDGTYHKWVSMLKGIRG